jgi:catechol 2,3-dioxygenase-like lactoylglutathione lyase family enzyme
MRRIASVTLLVDEYDSAIRYFVDTLDFVLVVDDPRHGGDRWVVVAPDGAGPGIRLAIARDQQQRQALGAQAGGRVLIVLHTDDLMQDYALYQRRGVVFLEAPREEPYGAVAVFADTYGNRWDLIQPT